MTSAWIPAQHGDCECPNEKVERENPSKYWCVISTQRWKLIKMYEFWNYSDLGKQLMTISHNK